MLMKMGFLIRDGYADNARSQLISRKFSGLTMNPILDRFLRCLIAYSFASLLLAKIDSVCSFLSLLLMAHWMGDTVCSAASKISLISSP
jgi:hypothetical protein